MLTSDTMCFVDCHCPDISLSFISVVIWKMTSLVILSVRPLDQSTHSPVTNYMTVQKQTCRTTTKRFYNAHTRCVYVEYYPEHSVL